MGRKGSFSEVDGLTSGAPGGSSEHVLILRCFVGVSRGVTRVFNRFQKVFVLNPILFLRPLKKSAADPQFHGRSPSLQFT